jgi:type III restriction enzyme
LIGEKGYSLTALVRSKFLLARALHKHLLALQSKAAIQGFQQTIFADDLTVDAERLPSIESRFDFSYQFQPQLYPARPPFYSGRYKFSKHYYPVIEDLKVDGEEFLCAQAIDANRQVKHWVRNLVDRPAASFRLPLGDRWFYPDFVAELKDGRLMVIEYKGAIYKTNDDSKVKNAIGELWARQSAGQCLFLMAVVTDSEGRNVDQQIDAAIRI